ncbi:hypothetical protein D3C84_226350 [compost metagenome]
MNDASHVDRGKCCCPVKWIVRVALSSRQARQRADDVLDMDWGVQMRGRDDAYGYSQFGSEQNMATSLLWQAVFDASHSSVPDLVTLVPEALYEVVVDLVFGDVRNVFHSYQVRLSFFDEAAEVIEQRPLAIVAGVFALVVG